MPSAPAWAIETVVPQFNDAATAVATAQGLAGYLSILRRHSAGVHTLLLALLRAGILRTLTLGEDYELQREPDVDADCSIVQSANSDV